MAHARITRAKGFHLEFSNGWCISSQFGWGNYCTNRDKQSPFESEYVKRGDHYLCNTRDLFVASEGSEEIEIAVWHSARKGDRDGLVDGGWVKLSEYDTIAGWIHVDKVGVIIGMLAVMDSEHSNEEVSERLREVIGDE